MLDSVDWVKPSRGYLALAFQGFVSVIVCDKALDYLKTRSLAADSFIINYNLLSFTRSLRDPHEFNSMPEDLLSEI